MKREQENQLNEVHEMTKQNNGVLDYIKTALFKHDDRIRNLEEHVNKTKAVFRLFVKLSLMGAIMIAALSDRVWEVITRLFAM